MAKLKEKTTKIYFWRLPKVDLVFLFFKLAFCINNSNFLRETSTKRPIKSHFLTFSRRHHPLGTFKKLVFWQSEERTCPSFFFLWSFSPASLNATRVGLVCLCVIDPSFMALITRSSFSCQLFFLFRSLHCACSDSIEFQQLEAKGNRWRIQDCSLCRFISKSCAKICWRLRETTHKEIHSGEVSLCVLLVTPWQRSFI